MTTDRPLLTIRAAAKAAGVSSRTMRRRLAAGAFPNAKKDETDPLGAWAIPVEDLLASGLTLYATEPEPAPTPGAAQVVNEDLEVIRLRAELVRERTRRQAAEMLLQAAERLQQTTERLADTERARADAMERALAEVSRVLRALVPHVNRMKTAGGHQRSDYTREQKIALARAAIGEPKPDAASYRDMTFYRWRLQNGGPKSKPARRVRSRAFRTARAALCGDPCGWCGKPWDETFHIDHILPVVRGGSDDLSNLTASCAPCNLSKGAKDWGYPPHRRGNPGRAPHREAA